MVVENVDGTDLRFKNPGRLLLVVISFIFVGVGFLDLLGHTSAEPDIFGLYSFPFFVLIILYGCIVALSIVLFFNANIQSRIVDLVGYIQNKTWLVLIFLIGIGTALWVILEWDRWARLPGLQFAAFGLVVIAGSILLLANWNVKNGYQIWRKILAYPLVALLLVEAILQISASMGKLPGVDQIGGDFYPYERVYINGENFRNDFANRYGWYFPDFSLDEEKKRILIVGGSYVQALPILPEQQASVLLSELMNQDQTEKPLQTEVIPIGLPGFGLSSFLFEDLISELPSILNPDEMIVFFHLGDDFQSPSDSSNSIRYTVSDNLEVKVHPEDARLRHDLTHYYLRAFMSFQLVETIRSNYLTPKVIASLVRNLGEVIRTASTPPNGNQVNFPRMVGFVVDNYDLVEAGHAGIKTTGVKVIPGGNNFMFLRDSDADRREAFEVAESILKTAQAIAREKNLTLRLVTVPTFPEEFYREYPSGDWGPQVGEYDLFLSERLLIEIADKYSISILPMGQFMLTDGLTVEEIRGLYQPNSQFSFTPAGHDYIARTIYTTFYKKE
jgi:hypothetical protein